MLWPHTDLKVNKYHLQTMREQHVLWTISLARRRQMSTRKAQLSLPLLLAQPAAWRHMKQVGGDTTQVWGELLGAGRTKTTFWTIKEHSWTKTPELRLASFVFYPDFWNGRTILLGTPPPAPQKRLKNLSRVVITQTKRDIMKLHKNTEPAGTCECTECTLAYHRKVVRY